MSYGIYEDGELLARFTAPMTVRSNHPIFMSDTLSLKRDVTRRNAQRWEIETSVEPLTRTANDLFVNFVTKGYGNTVTVKVPQNIGVIRTRTSVSSPSAVGSRGTSFVTVTNNSGFIPKGTFIQFSDHTKVYMTTSDLTNNGVLNIYPFLRKNLNTTFKHRDDIFMPCLYDTDTVSGMVFTDGILMDNGTIKLIERV